MRTNLCIPFEMKEELKKEGIKWDSKLKTWYIDNEKIPENLVKYVATEVFIDYEDKDYFKSKVKTMRWDTINKKWLVSQEDFDKIMKFRGD